MKGTTMKRFALAAAAVLALAGCSSSGNTVEHAAAASPAAAATTAAGPSVAAFGDTVTFPEGLTLKVTAAVVPAGQYAVGAAPDGKMVVLTVVATNTSKDPVNAGLAAFPTVTYGATGLAAPSAVDADVTKGSIGHLLPGETQTATHGFGIPADGRSSVRAEFSGLHLGDSPAVFKGAAG